MTWIKKCAVSSHMDMDKLPASQSVARLLYGNTHSTHSFFLSVLGSTDSDISNHTLLALPNCLVLFRSSVEACILVWASGTRQYQRAPATAHGSWPSSAAADMCVQPNGLWCTISWSSFSGLRRQAVHACQR